MVAGRSLGVLVVKPGPAHFQSLTDLCVAGHVGIHIDRISTLDEVPDGLAQVGEGRALGKVVVTKPEARVWGSVNLAAGGPRVYGVSDARRSAISDA